MLAQVIEETDELDELGNDPWDDAWFEGDRWSPETYEEDLIFSSAVNTNAPRISQLRPSQFTEFAFRMPREFKEVENETEEEWEARIKALEDAKQDLNFAPFSFEERPYMRRIYDTPARRVLLMCARQVEKSTLLGNIALCYMSLVPSFKLLYVNSSATQAKTFSNDRVKEPIETSPVLKKFTTQMLSSNILEKQFVNRSKITMRYAFLNADRTRGIPATGLEIDEFQDVLASNIPVIEQCTAHANPRHKRFWYAGTPKSLDNNIEKYWADRSTQNQWVVPHDCKGGEGGRHWNILGEGNIGKRSLVCNNVKCKQPIHPMADGATWGSQQKMTIDKATGKPVGRVQFDGYRIPQLMVPWKPWSEIVNDYETYPRDKFYNEVLGISFDSGLRPLTRAHIQSNCCDDIKMSEVDKYRALGYAQDIWAGIDWGTGENTYTVITLGTYVNMKFRVFYWHRFEGEENDPPVQLQKICELIEYFNVKMIGADYGGGFDRNDHLTRKFGPDRLMKFQYMARAQKKVALNTKLGRYQVARTEVMSDIFNAIKRANCFEFPRWAEFEKPHAEDMLNIFSEYNEKIRMIQYTHNYDNTDDSFHSLLYCFLASMRHRPRPDIIIPRREVNGRPVPMSFGPIDQG